MEEERVLLYYVRDDARATGRSLPGWIFDGDGQS